MFYDLVSVEERVTVKTGGGKRELQGRGGWGDGEGRGGSQRNRDFVAGGGFSFSNLI